MTSPAQAPHHLDVVIVGAGPAGSTTAISLLQHAPGMRVALVDAAAFPRDKTCGDGLGPGVARVLDALGLRHVLDGAVSPRAIRVVGPDGRVVSGHYRDIDGGWLRGHVLPRRIFDTRLVDEARAVGAEVMTARFVRTDVVADHRRVVLRSIDGEHHLTAGVLVGADGANSSVRRAIGLRRARDAHRLIAMRGYAHTPAWDAADALHFEFPAHLLPGYAWAFSPGRELTNLGVSVPLLDLQRGDVRLRDHFDAFVASLRQRGVRVHSVENVRAHHLPHAAGFGPSATTRAIVIGDAAAAINPLSGEGIHYAMRSGMTLGRELASVGRDADPGTAIRRFTRSNRRALRRHFHDCLLAHRLLRNRRLARRSIAAAEDPAVLDATARMLFDDGHLTGTTLIGMVRNRRYEPVR